MPAHQRLGTEDRDDLQDRRKPTIELDEEPAIVVRKLGPPSHLASQNDQLMSERRILCLKSALRLEWQGQHGQNEAHQRDHRLNLADSIAQKTRIWFSVHTAASNEVSRGRPSKTAVVSRNLLTCG